MNICVYCSAKTGIPDEYKHLGEVLGQWIAEQGHTLVFGGATGGIMTTVADTAYRLKGKVIGVIPERIVAAHRLSASCTETICVSNMNARKQTMKELADVFVALPGSYGTLDEMMDVIAAGTVGEHHKPIFVLNYNDYYAPLIMLATQMKQQGFIPQEESYKPTYVNSMTQLTEALDRHYQYLVQRKLTATTNN